MPVVTMIAGPNGSGKTTLYRNLMAEGLDFGEYLNADDIAKTKRGNPVQIGQEAQAVVRKRRDLALTARQDYCWETVMSHPSHAEHLLAARAAGYEVRLFYVALEDPQLNIRRVEERVLSGGHDVPNDRVKRRYFRSINNLSHAILAADHGRIFDNSSKDDPFELIASIDSQVLTLEKDWFHLPRWFIPALVDLGAR
jgi:predicted ABC-type ATPase